MPDTRGGGNGLEVADGVVTVMLTGVVAAEVITQERGGPLLVANGILFAVLLVLFAVRLRQRDEIAPWEWLVEVALLVCSIPVLPLGPFRVLRLLRLPLLGVKNGPQLRRQLVSRPWTVAIAAALVIGTGSLLILEAERGARDTNITSYGDALWWATATATTVGYGDLSPKTGLGRVIAAGLMVLGIALFGLMTALLARWLVDAKDAEES